MIWPGYKLRPITYVSNASQLHEDSHTINEFMKVSQKLNYFAFMLVGVLFASFMFLLAAKNYRRKTPASNGNNPPLTVSWNYEKSSKQVSGILPSKLFNGNHLMHWWLTMSVDSKYLIKFLSLFNDFRSYNYFGGNAYEPNSLATCSWKI